MDKFQNLQISILCCSQFYKSTGNMNVSTVFPEGLTETERSQRHASVSVKDDEDVQDRYNRKYRQILIFFYCNDTHGNFTLRF